MTREEFELANSVVRIESGRIARIVRMDGRTEYVGPLPDETVDALAEVAR